MGVAHAGVSINACTSNAAIDHLIIARRSIDRSGTESNSWRAIKVWPLRNGVENLQSC
jgi:hypothetical protein